MKKSILLLVTVSIVMLLVGCRGGSKHPQVSATGTIYECLLVVPDVALSASALEAVASSGACQETGSAYDEAVATLPDLLRAVMSEPMPCMPQIEPYFKTTAVPPAAFDNMLKPTRNILQVDINPQKYTQTKARYFADVWSHPQAVCRIQSPSADSMVTYWLNYGESIRDWFVREEMRRQAWFYRASTNKEARLALQAKIGTDMLIPEDYIIVMDTTLHLSRDYRVLWTCNNKGSMRRDLIIYSYPYTDANTFTQEYLCARRDEVLGRLVSGSVAGSHVGTEYKIFPPQMRELTVQNGGYAAEIRGLWKLMDGEAMGGPFVSHTRLNQVTGQVVTAEVFIFASGQKKRSALRQAEAVLYTMEMPQDKL